MFRQKNTRNSAFLEAYFRNAPPKLAQNRGNGLLKSDASRCSEKRADFKARWLINNHQRWGIWGASEAENRMRSGIGMPPRSRKSGGAAGEIRRRFNRSRNEPQERGGG